MGPRRAGRCRTKDNKKVAIKHIDRVFEVREDALRIVRELRFLRLLKHANVRPVSLRLDAVRRARDLVSPA